MSFPAVLPRAWLVRPTTSPTCAATYALASSIRTISSAASLARHQVHFSSASCIPSSPTLSRPHALARRHYSPPKPSRNSTPLASSKLSQKAKHAQATSARPASPFVPKPARPAPPTKGPDEPRPVETAAHNRKDVLRDAQAVNQGLFFGSKTVPFTRADERELYQLERDDIQLEIAVNDKIAFEKRGYLAFDQRSPNATVDRWLKELDERGVTQKSVWDEFLVPSPKGLDLRPVRSRKEDPSDEYVLRKLSLPRLPVVIVLTIVGSYLILEFEAAAPTASGSLWARYSHENLNYPIVGFTSAMLYVIFPAMVITVVSGVFGTIAMAAKRSTPAQVAALSAKYRGTANIENLPLWSMVKVVNFRPLQLWTAGFAQTSTAEYQRAVKSLIVFGLLAWGFFDQRRLFTDSPTWNRLTSSFTDNAGLWDRLSRIWTKSSSSPVESVVERPWTHYLAFAMTAIAFGNCANLVYHCLTRIPAARKTLVATLRSPELRKAHHPPLYLDPVTQKLVLSESLQLRYKIGPWTGLSDMTYANLTLALLQTTLGAWNPSYLFLLPLQYMAGQAVYTDIRKTVARTNAAGPLGHIPGIVFGVFWFFFGYAIWDAVAEGRSLEIIQNATSKMTGQLIPAWDEGEATLVQHKADLDASESLVRPTGLAAPMPSLIAEEQADQSSGPAFMPPVASKLGAVQSDPVSEPTRAKSSGWKVW